MPSLLLAFRNLSADRARLSLTVAATGLAVALILLLSGFVSGIDLQVSLYLDHEPGSIVVGQSGVSNLPGASSRLPSNTLEQVRATPGVAHAIQLLTQFVVLDLGARKQPVYLVGYDPTLGGGAWQLTAGGQPKDGEAVVDRVLAMRHGLGVGDQITILGQPFRISRLSAGTASFMTSNAADRGPGSRDRLPKEVRVMAARLVVENLTKRFGSGETEVVAVDNVSVEIEEGEVVLVMGPSGSGKTTLFQMLGGLLKPSSGLIRLDGQEITGLGESKLPGIRLHKVSFVFQDFHLLLALSVRENVAMVAMRSACARSDGLRRADEALSSMGLQSRLRYKPENLSGGEKQRVAIARALTNDPALILGDEPTANLDSKIGREIARLLHDIAKAR